MANIKIVRSGISVYEVEVDLGKYAPLRTDEIKGFTKKLLKVFPSLEEHECFAGDCGGFVLELERGTDLAHVMEHLILEMLKITHKSHRTFSGWTRKRHKTHVIHFQSPNALMGRRAALCAAKVVESIVEGKPLSKRAIMRELRDRKGGR